MLLWPDGSKTRAWDATLSQRTSNHAGDTEPPVDVNTWYAPVATPEVDEGLDFLSEPLLSPLSGSDEPRDNWEPEYESTIALVPTCTIEVNPVSSPQSYHLSPTVPHALEVVDAGTRELFSHFSTIIAPVMVVADSRFNGYRNLLIPMACEDSLVRAAVCVASLDFLAQQEPSMLRRAELGFQSILSQLRQRTSTRSTLVDLSAWAAIIILLTGETITGGTNLPYLFKILQHLAAANASHDRSSVMHAFLAEQTRMMTLFAQPLLEETSGSSALLHRSQVSFDFITNVGIFLPELSQELAIYSAAIHAASDLYVARATLNPPHSETVADVERLKALCERVHPATTGHHTLVWVYFIAAAESSTVEHREFFSARLREVYARTRFHNIPAALEALQQVWKMQARRRWTAVLPEVMPVFII